jgi:hypothetical protein
LRGWESEQMSLYDTIDASWNSPTTPANNPSLHVELGALAAASDTKLVLGVSEQQRIGVWVATAKVGLLCGKKLIFDFWCVAE